MPGYFKVINQQGLTNISHSLVAESIRTVMEEQKGDFSETLQAKVRLAEQDRSSEKSENLSTNSDLQIRKKIHKSGKRANNS